MGEMDVKRQAREDAALEALETAIFISGEPYTYGPDDAGYYDAVDEHRNHVVAGTFELDDAAARAGVALAVAPLGYCAVRINGERLVDVELEGLWSNYTRAVYVDVFDVTAYVHAGTNTIELELGNGFYNPAPITLFGKYNLRERLAEVGTPRVAAALVAGDACVRVTDGTWSVRPGALLFNNLYLGEVRDLRNQGTTAAGAPVRVWGRAGERNLLPSPLPPCRRLGRVAPVSVRDVADGVLVDFGEMVAGVVDVTFTAADSARVELDYAEVYDGDTVRFDSNVAGLVGLATPRGVCPGGPGAPVPAIQRDVLICGAGENTYTSTFTYHSFRYVLIRGLAAADVRAIEATYVHTDLASAGALDTGNPAFDLLLDAARRTKLNNVHGLFEDCSRERFGYGGDMVSLMHSNLMLFDEEGLLDKTLGDFGRDQTARGGLPETAPFMGIGSNGPAVGEGPLLWQLAYPYLACMADRYYGRRDLIEREWAGIERFGDYLLSFDPEKLAGHCLGDHGSVLTTEGDFHCGTPDKPFAGWCAILWGLMSVDEAGRRIGRDTARFAEGAETLRAEIRRRFERADELFGDATQSACAFAGMLGLGDAYRQAEALAADARARGGILTTGIFGTMLAFELLHREGLDEVVEAWLTRREHPSLLNMLASGSGALAEQFTEMLSSYDHAMFSSYAQWLFQALGGIRIEEDAVACDKVEVRPYFSTATDAVTCSHATPRGEISVAWRRVNGTIEVDVTAPVGIAVDMGALERQEGVVVRFQTEDEHVDSSEDQ